MTQKHKLGRNRDIITIPKCRLLGMPQCFLLTCLPCSVMTSCPSVEVELVASPFMLTLMANVDDVKMPLLMFTNVGFGVMSAYFPLVVTQIVSEELGSSNIG